MYKLILFTMLISLMGFAVTIGANPNDSDGVFLLMMFCLLIFSICFGLILHPMFEIQDVPWGNEENYLTHEIVNLKDNNELDGQFSGRYVRGYVGEETTYHYYYKDSDGGMKLKKVEADKATIYETDGTPRVEWYRQTRSFWWQEETKYYCKIYLPEGSVEVEYVIDME